MKKKNNNNKKEFEQNDEIEEVINPTDFSQKRVSKVSLKNFYNGEGSQRNQLNSAPNYKSLTNKIKKIEEITTILQKAVNTGINSNQKQVLVDTSTRMYMTNPIYADIINYLSKLFMFRYKVIPHKLYTSSKAKVLDNTSNQKDYETIYHEMLEVVDGISIETIFPEILTNLYVAGMVCPSTVVDKKKMCLSTLLLPPTFCRPIGQTQYGTSIIQFDFSYFDKLSSSYSNIEDLYEYIRISFSSEFEQKYRLYRNAQDKAELRWQVLDPRFSSAILLNPEGIPNLLYIIGSIINYERYQDNELTRSDNKLKYLVVQTMPHFQTDLIFTIDEVHDLHQSLRQKIEADENARLITTWGDVHVDTFDSSEDSDNEVLDKALKTIFNNAGLNSTLFTADSVEAMKMSILKDKSILYTYIESIVNFYTMAVNNGWDWKTYQADIEILPISNYTYNDDIEIYRNNATLGVNKLDYLIASGTKQKNIQDQIILEDYLGLDKLKPLQTSYTQSDEAAAKTNQKDSANSKESEIEPSDKVEDRQEQEQE